jgi:hypothetical protein
MLINEGFLVYRRNDMNKIISVSLIIIFFFIFVCAGISYAKEYPVKWTKHVKIKSLDEIDNVLNNYVDPYAGTTHELTLTNDNDDQQKVTTYKRYKELRDKGYYSASNMDALYQFRFIRNCITLELLKKAKPSSISFVRNLKLSDNPLKNLPQTLDLFTTFEEEEEAEIAFKEGKTWEEFNPLLVYEVKDDYDINIYETQGISEDDEYSGSDIYITLQAWGDFNNDSIEDILLSITYFVKDATFRWCTHALLTRLQENGRLIDISDQLEH